MSALGPNAQLFDQDGNPLDLVDAGDQRFSTIYDVDGVESTVVPSDSVPGRVGWNVYPLRETLLAQPAAPTRPRGQKVPVGHTRTGTYRPLGSCGRAREVGVSRGSALEEAREGDAVGLAAREERDVGHRDDPLRTGCAPER